MATVEQEEVNVLQAVGTRHFHMVTMVTVVSSKQLQTASSVFGENDQLVNVMLVVVGIYVDTFLRFDLSCCC